MPGLAFLAGIGGFFKSVPPAVWYGLAGVAVKSALVFVIENKS